MGNLITTNQSPRPGPPNTLHIESNLRKFRTNSRNYKEWECFFARCAPRTIAKKRTYKKIKSRIVVLGKFAGGKFLNDVLLEADFWEVGTFWHRPQGGKNILKIKKNYVSGAQTEFYAQ